MLWKYHEEEFDSKPLGEKISTTQEILPFALLSEKDFQEKPQTREGPQTLQFARLKHI